MVKLVLLAIVVSTLASPAAVAHPGHGEPSQAFSVAHHLSEPAHLIAWLACVLFVLAAAIGWRHRRFARHRTSC